MNQSFTLKMFGTGQITVPKIWRDEFATTHFQAQRIKQGVLLRPVTRYEEVIFNPPRPAATLSKQVKNFTRKHDGQLIS